MLIRFVTTFAILLCVGVAHADTTWSQSDLQTTSVQSEDWLTGSFAGTLSLAVDDQSAGDKSEQKSEAPAVPDSAALLLCGLGTISAFRLTHSARQGHLSHLPTWYHSAAPQQIGHAFVLDLDRIDMPVLCFIESPFDGEVDVSRHARHEEPPQHRACWFALAHQTRGPPPLSLN